MEVILLDAVSKLGTRGQVVKVKPGYARNYLLPMGLATIATDANKMMVERHRQRQEAVLVAKRRELQALADKVKDYSVTLEANATEEGQLYGSIVAADISKALKNASYPIEATQIKMEGPIKALGMYTIPIRFDRAAHTIAIGADINTVAKLIP